MLPERWQRIQKIVEAVKHLAPDERTSFLDVACGADAELRHKLESLVWHWSHANGFLETAALNIAAEFLPHPDLAGKTFGPYHLIACAGAGGMGVVYRAEDRRLHRTVAIKVLTGLAGDRDLKHRFQREAQAIA